MFTYLYLAFVLVFLCYPFKYDDRVNTGIFQHFKDSVMINAGILFVYTFIMYLLHLNVTVSRLFTAMFIAIDTIVMYIAFRVLRNVFERYDQTHQRHAVVFASSENIDTVINNITNYGPTDVVIDGVAILDKSTKKFTHVKLDSAGKIVYRESHRDIETYLRREVVDMAFISIPNIWQSDIMDIIHLLDSMGIPSYLGLNDFNVDQLQRRFVNIGQINAIEYSPRNYSEWDLMMKRAMDILGALVGCLICGIFLIFVGPLIYLEDPGPIFFKQKRVGKNGRYFYMYKFRSMYQDAEARKAELMKDNEMNGLMFKIKDDPRITKVGRFIRKTSIDEFPQFFNVLKGDMSLVGTRPPTIDEFEHYDNHHKRRLGYFKPGITGMWQASGRSDITDFEEVVRLDCYYIDNWTFLLDIEILFKTVGAVLMHKGSE